MVSRRWLTVIASVILLILVSTGLVFIVVRGQSKANDIKRLSNLAVVRLALERYYFLRNQYPLADQTVALGENEWQVLCDTDSGFQATTEGCTVLLLEQLPEGYRYTSNGETYTIDFYLERPDTGLSSGWHQATPQTIK